MKIKIKSVDEQLVGAVKMFSIENVKKCDKFSQKIIPIIFLGVCSDKIPLVINKISKYLAVALFFGSGIKISQLKSVFLQTRLPGDVIG